MLYPNTLAPGMAHCSLDKTIDTTPEDNIKSLRSTEHKQRITTKCDAIANHLRYNQICQDLGVKNDFNNTFSVIKKYQTRNKSYLTLQIYAFI